MKDAPYLLTLPHHVLSDRFEQLGIITGFDKEACRTIIRMAPSLLSLNTGTLLTKLHVIRKLVAEDNAEQLQHVLLRYPSLLSHSSSNLMGDAHTCSCKVVFVGVHTTRMCKKHFTPVTLVLALQAGAWERLPEQPHLPGTDLTPRL